MKKFKLGKKYMLHTNDKTYECIVKARNELFKPYAVYVILDIKLTMDNYEHNYTRLFKVMDTSYECECESVELTSDYYGSILTADNKLNDGTIHQHTLKYIKDTDVLRAFLLEHKCMQLPQQNYDMILHDIIVHHNSYYTTQQIANRYDFSFKSLYYMFTQCNVVYDSYYNDTPNELLNVLIDDRIAIQLMHNIVEYAKIVYNTPKYKDLVSNMIDIYNTYYKDYMSRFTK